MAVGVRPKLINPCQTCGALEFTASSADRIARCAKCNAVCVCRREPDRLASPIDLRRVWSWAPGGVLRGKYRLVEPLGVGAHGATYLAEHLYLDHLCVVKVLSALGTVSDAGSGPQLMAEARLGYRVNHPNVVRVLDCDVSGGVWYFVMDYVEGLSLHEIRRDAGALPWMQAHRLALHALAGLDAIHRAGIVHMDIKPGNLLLGADQELRIADLGVARMLREPQALAGGSAAASGTVYYAAPELLVAGAAVDVRADLYSLGATLYELVCGEPPHADASVFATLLAQQRARPHWPAHVAEAPEWFQAAILGMLDPDPDKRFASAREAGEAMAQREPASGRWDLGSPGEPPPGAARGIGLLPLTNRSSSERWDWIGYALTDHLGRVLSKGHAVYVVEQDRLLALLDKTPAELPVAKRYLAAGARAGAGTVLVGEYEASEGQLAITLRILRSAESAAQTDVVELRGSPAGLGELQDQLVLAVEQRLGLGQARTGQATTTPSAEAQELYGRARQAYMRADYRQAIELARQASQLQSDYADAIGLTGVCCARIGDYAAAEESHRRHMALADSRRDPRLLVEAHANLGAMYYYQGRYEQAHQHLAQAAGDAESLGLVAESAQIHNNLGFVLLRLERAAQAEQAFRKAIDTHRAYGAAVALIGPYNGLGTVLTEQGRCDEARDYYRRALALAEELGDRANIGTSHMHLGHSAVLLGRYDEAKQEFALALNTLEQTAFWNGLARLYEYMANMNLRLGRGNEAARCAQRRAELARQHANQRIEAAAWRQLAQALEMLGDGPAAADASRKAEQLDPPHT